MYNNSVISHNTNTDINTNTNTNINANTNINTNTNTNANINANTEISTNTDANSRPKYKMAIFDMDGTILNTIDDLAASINHALRVNGMPEHSVVEVKGFVGNGIRKLVERAVPLGTEEEDIDRVFASFHEYYKDNCAVMTKPYDGIVNVLDELKRAGVILAVVSNKAEYAVKQLCEDYFPGTFDIAAGDVEGRRRKPYPDSVNAVLEKMKVNNSEAVYIGDSEVDINTAKNAGMDLIEVGWGFKEEEFLLSEGAPFVIHNPEDISAIIINSK